MKSLFLTTRTNETASHVRAWESAFGPAVRVVYDHTGLCNDWQIVETVEREKPDLAFYIGAHKAPGNPKVTTLAEIRKRVPAFVNLCSDAADTPWHPVLETYQRHELFALQVALDGARGAPGIDHPTLTPVDPRPFAGPAPRRDIRCGFSGTVGRWNPRSEIVNALRWFGGLTVRDRAKRGDGTYEEHVAFLRRCRMVLNLSHTGSGQAHHVKGRVLEAGHAGCCLLESAGSPIVEWFPPECYLTFKDPKEAAEIIAEASDGLIERTAAALAREVRARFTAKHIYGAILEKIGVGPAEQKPAA